MPMPLILLLLMVVTNTAINGRKVLFVRKFVDPGMTRLAIEISMYGMVEYVLVYVKRILGAIGPDSGKVLISVTFVTLVISDCVTARKNKEKRDRNNEYKPPFKISI